MTSERRRWLYWIAAGSGIIGIWGLLRIQKLIAHPDYFAGKVVLITGASRGIGRALAYVLAERGASLILTARTESQLNLVAQTCRRLNPSIEVLAVPADVTEPSHRGHLIHTALEQMEHIDILVNNAGIVQGGAFLAVDQETLRDHLEVNLLAVTAMTRLVLPSMLKRKSGVIINMSSVMGRHAIPYFTAYSISKHALNGFGEGLRREIAGQGIRIITVSIGFADTDMVSKRNRQLLRPFGVRVVPVEKVAQHVLDAIVLEQIEVSIGGIEFMAAWITRFSPALADWMWRTFGPAELADAAAENYTE